MKKDDVVLGSRIFISCFIQRRKQIIHYSLFLSLPLSLSLSLSHTHTLTLSLTLSIYLSINLSFSGSRHNIRNKCHQYTFCIRGKHRVYVYLNGMEVKGSAFSLRIGKDIKENRTNKTESFKVIIHDAISGNVKKVVVLGGTYHKFGTTTVC